MFEPGEIVVCIDKEINYASNDGGINEKSVSKGLTIGKKYQVKFVKNHYTYFMVYLMNDYNILSDYYGYRFVTLGEHRKQKLDKICSKLTI